jgi:hypothetical protein
MIPFLWVGDEDAPVPVDLEAVGSAVVFADHVEASVRAHPEDPSPGNVDAIEVAVAVKRWSLEERVHVGAAALHAQPFGVAAALAQMIGQAGEDFGLDDRRWGEHGAILRLAKPIGNGVARPSIERLDAIVLDAGKSRRAAHGT